MGHVSLAASSIDPTTPAPVLTTFSFQEIIMTNVRILVATLALAAAGMAQAQEATIEPPAAQPSIAKSRADIIAETIAARAQRRLMAGNEGPGMDPSAHGGKTREEVRREAIAARAQLAAWPLLFGAGGM
jgi:hypothetical protein